MVLLRDRAKPWADWIEGTVLFADVSGFTSMAEELSRLDTEGAEILSEILNRYFSRMVQIVHSFGGEVMRFAGDSISCLFAGNQKARKAARNAALEMQKEIHHFENLRTPLRKYSLQMKIGIASGKRRRLQPASEFRGL
jgi:class 3 adenylate cyclase